MVRMIFDPEDKNGFYKFVDIQFGIHDSDGIEDYFEAFKSFCHAVGFKFIEDYELVQKEYPWVNHENCGEILTQEQKDMLNKKLPGFIGKSDKEED